MVSSLLRLCCVWLLASFAPLALAQAPATGTLRGTVVEDGSNFPVTGAVIALVGTSYSATTGETGSFLLPGIPEGIYTLSIAATGYPEVTITDLLITAGEIFNLPVAVQPADIIELDAITVSATLLEGSAGAIIALRRDSVALVDSLGNETIRRMGASTAASALKVVVGTSIQDGKYVVVRGLADRYSVTTLAGVTIPTADPDKRAVQLDLFPARLIESINVSKTFTPDQPSDATGGGVNIIPMGIPQGVFLDVNFGASYAVGTTGNDDFLTYPDGGVSFLPFGQTNNDRSLPATAELLPRVLVTSPTDAQARTFSQATQAFSQNMGVSRRQAGLNTNFSIQGGNRWAIGDGFLGLSASFAWRNDFEYTDDRRDERWWDISNSATYEPFALLDTEVGEESVLWGALVNLGWRINDEHRLEFSSLLNQSGTDQAVLQIGAYENVPSRFEGLLHTQRILFSNRFRGEHKVPALGGLTIDWSAALTVAGQDQPDARNFSISYNTFANSSSFRNLGGSFFIPTRIWRELEDVGHQFSANVKWPFTIGSDRSGFLKTGILVDRVARDFIDRQYQYISGPQNTVTRGPGQPNSWAGIFAGPQYTPEAANVAGLRYYLQERESELQPDYSGDQEINAFYGMGEITIFPNLRFNLGARLESARLFMLPRTNTNLTVLVVEETSGGGWVLNDNVPIAQATADLEEDFFLPAASLSWEIVKNVFARASYGETITRPTFKELSPAITQDRPTDSPFAGSPRLKNSSNKNYDLRFEWLLGGSDIVALSLFYKEITDPIEYLNVYVVFSDFTVPVNYESGEVRGLEFEVQKDLAFMGSWADGFRAGFNYSYFESSVEVPERERILIPQLLGSERRLYGQPEYLANVNLSYTHPTLGFGGDLFYNRKGEVLVAGAAYGQAGSPASIVEEETETLDLSVRWPFLDYYSLTFRARNVLDGEIRRRYDFPDTNATYSSYTQGREFSLSVSGSW